MNIPVKSLAAVAVAAVGLIAAGSAAPTHAGYVDTASATATVETAPPGAYVVSDDNRTLATGASLAGGSVYLWGALGGGLAANGKWNVASDGASSPAATRVDLPVTSDPKVDAPIKVKQIALNGSQSPTGEYTAYNTAVALSEDGGVYTWGSNDGGRLGTGNTNTGALCTRGLTQSCAPGPILTGIKKIGATGNAFYALADNGDLFAWGSAKYTSPTVVPTATGEFGKDGSGKDIAILYAPQRIKTAVSNVFTSATGRYDLDANNVLTFSGYSTSAVNPSSLGTVVFNGAMTSVMAGLDPADPVVQLVAAYNNGYVITKSGAFYSWGDKGPQLGWTASQGSWFGPKKLFTSVKDVAAAASGINVVASDGSVWGWGLAWAAIGQVISPAENIATPRLISGLGTDNIAISALPKSTFVTKADYSLRGWGSAGGPTGPLIPGAKLTSDTTYGWMAPITAIRFPGIR